MLWLCFYGFLIPFGLVWMAKSAFLGMYMVFNLYCGLVINTEAMDSEFSDSIHAKKISYIFF